MIAPSFSVTSTERVLPKLALDFTTASLDSRITFTRTGNTATVVNSNGYVAPINADLPRFDYDPITLVCKGLLIEESRSNSALQSQSFTTSPWVSNIAGYIVTDNVETSPANDTTAASVVVTSGVDAFNTNTLVQTTPSLAAGTYTYSVFVKDKSAGGIRLQPWTVSTANTASASFNLADGTIIAASSTGTVTNVSATILNYQNGWYRISVTFTTASNAVLNLRQFARTSTGATFIGDGDKGYYIWGAQIEAGAFATSYIPTQASQVTRTADIVTMTGANFSDWYSAGAGGVVARVLPSTVSGTRPALQFDDATANEVITLRGNTTNPELVVVDGGAPQAQIDAGTIAANTAYNLGAAWDTDNCAAAVNGGVAVTDTTAIIPTVTQVRLGSDGTNYLNGQIQTVRYWPQRIINAEVQAFSK
jgi:hypothetical protein